MKPVLLFLLLLLGTIANAQNDDDDVIYKAPENYEFTKPTRVIKCTDLRGIETSDTFEVARGTVFYLIEVLPDESALIQFWRFPDEKLNKLLVDENSTKNLQKRMTFKVLKTDFKNKIKRRYSTVFITKGQVPFSGTSIVGGVTLIPFKFRPNVNVNGVKKGFDFSKDVQIGLSGGIKQRISKYNPFYLNVLFNIGISSVTMDDYNTNNTLTSSVDIVALTKSFGLVLDFKKIQFGAFLGWDKVSDKNKNNWIYQGKTWWSIGFGYSIFSTSTANSSAKETSK